LFLALLCLASLFVLCTTLAGADAGVPAADGDGCPGNAVVNGDFRQGSSGWYTYTSGIGWKKRPLIDCSPNLCRANCCAAFGEEGVWETVTQTVTMPAGGVLSYWWRMWVTEPDRRPIDSLVVGLHTSDGTRVAWQAHDSGEAADIWRRDILDVSAYAGQTLELRLAAQNDNYYTTSFYVDDICLQAKAAPVVPESSTLALMGVGAGSLMAYISLQVRARRGGGRGRR
jgi:hypothetical protein